MMIPKTALVTVLFLLALSVAPAFGPNVVPVGYEVNGNQVIVTLANSGAFNATVSVTVFQAGESLGTTIVTVPAGSTAQTARGINDDLNPFETVVSAAVPD